MLQILTEAVSKAETPVKQVNLRWVLIAVRVNQHNPVIVRRVSKKRKNEIGPTVDKLYPVD